VAVTGSVTSKDSLDDTTLAASTELTRNNLNNLKILPPEEENVSTALE
jgi:hypothetical protein